MSDSWVFTEAKKTLKMHFQNVKAEKAFREEKKQKIEKFMNGVFKRILQNLFNEIKSYSDIYGENNLSEWTDEKLSQRKHQIPFKLKSIMNLFDSNSINIYSSYKKISNTHDNFRPFGNEDEFFAAFEKFIGKSLEKSKMQIKIQNNPFLEKNMFYWDENNREFKYLINFMCELKEF